MRKRIFNTCLMFLSVLAEAHGQFSQDGIIIPSEICSICKVVSKPTFFGVKEVLVGYNNVNNLHYIKIEPSDGYHLTAIERVIFRYTRGGLEVFAYIPEANESNLTLRSIRKFDPLKLQSVSNIELFRLGSRTVSQGIVDSSITIGMKKFEEEFSRRVQLNGPAGATYKRTYSYRQSKSELRAIYRRKRLLRVFVELDAGAALSYRNIRIASLQPDRSAYEARFKNDKGGFSRLISAKFGYSLTAAGAVYVSVMKSWQQYRSAGEVDWSTGKLLPNSGSHINYDFKYRGLEVGYSQSRFSAKSGLSADLGLHFLWDKSKTVGKTFTWGPNVSIGPKFQVGVRSDLRLMPSFYLNIRTLESTLSNELATRLFNAGMKMSWRVYI